MGACGPPEVDWLVLKGALWARVGRHWLVLAMATLLAVAYGTRREDAEARHREPGHLRRARGPSGPRPSRRVAPLGVTAATAGCVAPSRSPQRLLQQGAGAAICGPACGCGPRPVPTSAPRGSPACAAPAMETGRQAPEPTRALGAGPTSHSFIALSTARPPRPSASRGPPHRSRRTHRSPPRKYPCEGRHGGAGERISAPFVRGQYFGIIRRGHVRTGHVPSSE